MLTERLTELVAIVRDLDRPVARLLLPGLSRPEVEAFLGPSVPDEVVTWFGWCNGVRSEPGQLQDDVNLIPGYNPLSLAEAAEARTYYEGDPVLGPQWIPLLGGPSGDLKAAVWEDGGPLRIAGVLIGEPTEIEYESVEQMVDYHIRCYRAGAFSVDDEGYLTMDPDRCDEIYEGVVRG